MLKLQNQRCLCSFLSGLCNFQSKQAIWINLPCLGTFLMASSISWRGLVPFLVIIFMYCKDVSLNQTYNGTEVLITIRNSPFDKDLIPMWDNTTPVGGEARSNERLVAKAGQGCKTWDKCPKSVHNLWTVLLCTCLAAGKQGFLVPPGTLDGIILGGLFCKEECNKVESLYSLCASPPQHPEGPHASTQRERAFWHHSHLFLEGHQFKPYHLPRCPTTS